MGLDRNPPGRGPGGAHRDTRALRWLADPAYSVVARSGVSSRPSEDDSRLAGHTVGVWQVLGGAADRLLLTPFKGGVRVDLVASTGDGFAVVAQHLDRDPSWRRCRVTVSLDDDSTAAGASAFILSMSPSEEIESVTEGCVAEIDLDVEATVIYVGVCATGEGSAVVKDIAVEVLLEQWLPVPLPVPLTDLSFGPPGPVEARQLAQATTPLSSVAVTEEHADLRSFIESCSAADVVGLGEATHGTAEHFILKHRLIAALIQRADVDVVAFEANAHESKQVDAYLQGGAGSAEQAALDLGFGVWATAEVAALLGWLRDWNQGRAGRPVRFIGVDIQSFDGPMTSLLDAARVMHAIDHEYYVAEAMRLAPGGMPDADSYTELQALLEELGSKLTKARPGDLGLASSARSAIQHLEMAGSPDPIAAMQVRDRAMAQNLLVHLESRPGSKAVLWAHNGHIARARYAGRVDSTGTHLAAALGERYRPVLLTQGCGGFHASPRVGEPFREATVAAPGPSSLDGQLMVLGHEASLTDLRDLPGPCASWLRSSAPTFECGSVWSEQDGRIGPTRDAVAAADWIGFTRSTTPTRPLRSRRGGGG